MPRAMQDMSRRSHPPAKIRIGGKTDIPLNNDDWEESNKSGRGSGSAKTDKKDITHEKTKLPKLAVSDRHDRLTSERKRLEKCWIASPASMGHPLSIAAVTWDALVALWQRSSAALRHAGSVGRNFTCRTIRTFFPYMDDMGRNRQIGHIGVVGRKNWT